MSLEAPGVAPRPDSCRLAGRRELDLDWSGIVKETNDVDGSYRSVGGDLAEPPVMVAGLVPEVGADGEDGAAETIGTILVRDEAVAWRQLWGALGWREFSLGSTEEGYTGGTTDFPVGVEVVCLPSNEKRAA